MASVALPSRRVMFALDRVRARTGVSLTFGGEVHGSGDLALRHFSGRTVGALPGVVLAYDAGLGGRSVATRLPIAVNDYFRSDRISHTYDRIIQAEGLRSMVAAPIIVDRKPVGVLYGAVRNDDVIGGRIVDTLIDEARSLEHEIVTMNAIRGRDTEGESDVVRLRAQLRSAYTRLRDLSSRTTDEKARHGLQELADELFGSGVPEEDVVHLTARELDVLCLVAAGCTNPAIADRLGLTLFTVKGYMKTLMGKLQATTRIEAVAKARAAGIMP